MTIYFWYLGVRKLIKFFVGLVVLGMILMLLPITVLSGDDPCVVNLNTDLSPERDCGNCAGENAPAGYSCVKYNNGDDNLCTYTWTAPQCAEGTATIDYVWIKAGNTFEDFLASSNDCYTLTGIGTSTVSVTETGASDCQDISHICFYWKCEEDEPDPGYIKVYKDFTNGVSASGSFTINVYDVSSGGSSGEVCIGDEDIINGGTYWVSEKAPETGHRSQPQ